MLCVLPCKALREEGQAPKNLLTVVELLHIRRRDHCETVVVHDAKVVQSQAVTYCNPHHDISF